MLLINLFGVPGSGKSTGAAYIFSKLKMLGVNAELVAEFAKDKVYEESKAVFDNQAYIFGKQWFRITRLENKVDVVITDSPILLSVFYNNDPRLGSNFDKMVLDIFNSYQSINYLINRVKPYNPSGRFQTEEQSNALVPQMRKLLNSNDISFLEIEGNEEGYDEVIKNAFLMNRLEQKLGQELY